MAIKNEECFSNQEHLIQQWKLFGQKHEALSYSVSLMIPSPLSKPTSFSLLLNQQLTPVAFLLGQQVLPKEN